MNEFFNKLSSYHLFNNLLPGILFVVLLNKFTEYQINYDNLLVSAFLFYFLGMTISRISSIIIEPFLKKIKFVRFKEYKLFVEAYKKDNKLEIFVETNNKFRVLFTMLILIILAKLFYSINLDYLDLTLKTQEYILLISLAVIYLFSYRKQTNYITKRIDANK
ncbi:hypothetical protein OBK24_12205 [Empedobacter falsenii]